MAELETIVEPRPGVTPPPEPEPTAEGGADLPDDLLAIPAFQAITAGQPAAFSASLAEFEAMPEAQIIAANKDGLLRAGFSLYRSLDGSKGAVINGLFLSPEDVKAADQAGQLEQLAPPFTVLNQQVATSGGANPVLQEGGERPTGFAMSKGSPAPATAPLAAAAPRPQSAAAQKSLSNARSKNLQPGSPTSGAAPGGGALLRSILKPVV